MADLKSTFDASGARETRLRPQLWGARVGVLPQWSTKCSEDGVTFCGGNGGSLPARSRDRRRRECLEIIARRLGVAMETPYHLIQASRSGPDERSGRVAWACDQSSPSDAGSGLPGAKTGSAR